MSGSKNWYNYRMEYYTAERQKELLPFATAWVELENITLSEISQSVKNKYHMTFTYKRNLMNKINE